MQNSKNRRAFLFSASHLHRSLFPWLVMLGCPAVFGATYYVAPSGLDTNSGTSLAAPFQTLSRAATAVNVGDTCYIRAGVYRETLKMVRSGTASAPITFAAYPNETVTISGADVVTNWTPSSGSIYQAPMNWDLGMGYNQIFVDGQMMFQARFPNMGATNGMLNPTLSNITLAADGTVTSTEFTQPDGYWAGGYMVGRVNESWSWQWATITSSSASGTLKVTPESSPRFTGAGQVYLIGKQAALDAQKEWHYANNTLFLWAPASDNPGAHLVEAKRRAWTVDFNGQSFVTVSGLKLFAGAVSMSGKSCVLQNCDASYLSHFTLFPWSGLDGNGGGPNGYQGITIYGSNNTVTGCSVANTAGINRCISSCVNMVSSRTLCPAAERRTVSNRSCVGWLA